MIVAFPGNTHQFFFCSMKKTNAEHALQFGFNYLNTTYVTTVYVKHWHRSANIKLCLSQEVCVRHVRSLHISNDNRLKLVKYVNCS